MKALYCIAMYAFFKLVEESAVFTDKELEHLARGDWISVDLADSFDGNLSHYKLDDGTMVLIPSKEWPENQIEEEAE